MDSYKKLLKKVLETGEYHKDRTGVGTKSVFGAYWEHDMAEGQPVLTTKKIAYKSMIAELLWFLRGSSDNNALREMGSTIWDPWATEEMCAKFGRDAGDLGHIYGPAWRNFLNHWHSKEVLKINRGAPSNSLIPPHGDFFNDQIAGLLYMLFNEPSSRRMLVSAWHPLLQRDVELPPCHFAFQLKCHGDNELSLQFHMRSADLFLGVPFNMASYGALLTILATVTGRVPRYLKASFGDLHIYNNHRDAVYLILERPCRRLPTLSISNLDRKDTWQDSLSAICDLTVSDFSLIGYDPHPTIKAEVAV